MSSAIANALSGLDANSTAINVVSGNLIIDSGAVTGPHFNINLSTTDLDGCIVSLPTFDNTIGHSWAIIVVNSGSINGFDPTAFTIDTTNFQNSLGTGTFFMSLSGDSHSLMLNFTPVPEPSTWALLLCGAGAVLLPALKRRKSEIRISKSETNPKPENFK